MRYLVDGGYASDTDGKLGRAGFALNMLGEGAGELGSLEFSAAKENLGARLSASASLDGSSASLSALKENLDESVALFADRSEEHTSELQSLMRISYAVFCLKKKK